MRIVDAMLVSRVVPGWPEQVIAQDVPLGTAYRVDLDSLHIKILRDKDHPEYGSMQVESVREVEGFTLPVVCLRIDP